jgi:hypothetical protein
MIKNILENSGFLKTKNMLGNLGYCVMMNTLKNLGQRINKALENYSTIHHK